MRSRGILGGDGDRRPVNLSSNDIDGLSASTSDAARDVTARDVSVTSSEAGCCGPVSITSWVVSQPVSMVSGVIGRGGSTTRAVISSSRGGGGDELTAAERDLSTAGTAGPTEAALTAGGDWQAAAGGELEQSSGRRPGHDRTASDVDSDSTGHSGGLVRRGVGSSSASLMSSNRGRRDSVTT